MNHSTPRNSPEQVSRITSATGNEIQQLNIICNRLEQLLAEQVPEVSSTTNEVPRKTPEPLTLAEDQKLALLGAFSENCYPSQEACSLLAQRLGLTETQVEQWFEVHRSRIGLTGPLGTQATSQPTHGNARAEFTHEGRRVSGTSQETQHPHGSSSQRPRLQRLSLFEMLTVDLDMF